MKNRLEEKHVNNDISKYHGYSRLRENEIREREKKKLANRRKNKRKQCKSK